MQNTISLALIDGGLSQKVLPPASWHKAAAAAGIAAGGWRRVHEAHSAQVSFTSLIRGLVYRIQSAWLWSMTDGARVMHCMRQWRGARDVTGPERTRRGTAAAVAADARGDLRWS